VDQGRALTNRLELAQRGVSLGDAETLAPCHLTGPWKDWTEQVDALMASYDAPDGAEPG